jgi:hypothetical protein
VAFLAQLEAEKPQSTQRDAKENPKATEEANKDCGCG